MALGWVECANAVVGIGVGIAFIVTFSVAAANGGFVDVDATGADNTTLATLHYAADRVTETLSDLDIDIDTYGPAVQVGCRMAEVECPHKISGVAVGSIVTGTLSLLFFLVALWLRSQRVTKQRGRRLEGGYPDL